MGSQIAETYEASPLTGRNVDLVEPSLDGSGLRIGIVRSRFNAYAGNGLLKSCLDELLGLGVAEEDVTVVEVPGALEIPYALTLLARTDEYDALVAIGAVIRGETYHFDLVANESARGIMQVGLDFDIPIANAVLTTDNDEQMRARLVEKGRDAARVAVEMANYTEEFKVQFEDGDE